MQPHLPHESTEPDSSLDSFLNYAFHELSTPLTVLYSYVQFALDTLPNEPALAHTQRFLGNAIKQGDKTIDMLGEFLEAARLLNARMYLDCLEMSLTPLLEQIVTERTPTTPINLNLETETAKALVNIDAPRIKQALEHLLTFIEDTLPQNQPEPVALVSFTVSLVERTYQIAIHAPTLVLDTENQTGLFDFYRPLHLQKNKTAIRPKTTNSGMGLYVAHGVIQLHGGNLRYAADLPGFYLTLPIVEKKEGS